ncbi:MAG TPA: class I SAM-dependent methyltransferase [Acidimicrobiales bacterium]|nr:class I SAM-dependent methyltransferase [Acidimicrobiales bacterium]
MTVIADHREDSDDRAPLLLHSLSALREVIFPCLDISGARTLVEVGGEDGAFTKELVAWAEKTGGKVHCVDPQPSPKLVELCSRSEAAELTVGRSPQALEDLEEADVYVLDGDHNYHTVRSELDTIERKNQGGAMPLVFLHDVGWPCGRRDQYYSPESLPGEAVHPYTYDRGVTPESTGVVPGGFRGGGEFAVALKEGGEANGVLTAVEDFLEARDDLALATVPCVFGLGIIYPTSSTAGRSVAEFLRFYDSHPLLERLEHNRLALYLRVLELQDDIASLWTQLASLSTQAETFSLQHRDAATENRALWARNVELEAHLKLLRDEAANLLDSRAFALAERLAKLRGSKAPSRDRLRAALEGKQPA